MNSIKTQAIVAQVFLTYSSLTQPLQKSHALGFICKTIILCKTLTFSIKSQLLKLPAFTLLSVKLMELNQTLLQTKFKARALKVKSLILSKLPLQILLPISYFKLT